MSMQESVTLIDDIGGNSKNDEAALTTKLASALNLPGQWRVSIMDISYPHQWTTIYRDLTFAVMMPFYNAVPEYDHNSILNTVQPNPDRKKFVATEKLELVSKAELNLFYDLKDINFWTGERSMKSLRILLAKVSTSTLS